jgi:hypothetical protein
MSSYLKLKDFAERDDDVDQRPYIFVHRFVSGDTLQRIIVR